MRLRQQLSHFLQRHKIKSDETVLLALSGGLDSVVLLHALLQAKQKLVALHCNFQLRSEESEADESWIFQLSRDWNFPLRTKRSGGKQALLDAYPNHSIQMAAREFRYSFFEECRIQEKANWIFTAHHKQDQAETILLQFTKGAHLTGIPEKRGTILRPFLELDRAEILQYAHDNGLSWREDSSNQQAEYERNFLRLKVLPLLRQINPDLDTTLHLARNRWAAQMPEVEWISQELCMIKIPDDPTQPLDWEQAFPNLILSLHDMQALQSLFFSNKGASQKIGDMTFFREKHALSGIRMANFSFSGDYRAESDCFVYQNEIFPLSGNWNWWGLPLKWKYEFPPQSHFKIRAWQKGDRYSDSKFNKKISDIFQQAGVPACLRAHWPVVLVDDRIINFPIPLQTY